MSFLSQTGPEFSSVTLTDTTYTSNLGGLSLPFTISFKSSAVGRKIEISTEGTIFAEPTYDVNLTNLLSVVIVAPISKVRVTGAIGDILSFIK